MMGVGWCETGRIQVQDVTRLSSRVGPVGGRHGEQFDLDSALPLAYQRRLGLDFRDHAADIRGLLRSHAAVLVEIDRSFTHGARSRQFVVRPTDRQN